MTWETEDFSCLRSKVLRGDVSTAYGLVLGCNLMVSSGAAILPHSCSWRSFSLFSSFLGRVTFYVRWAISDGQR